MRICKKCKKLNSHPKQKNCMACGEPLPTKSPLADKKKAMEFLKRFDDGLPPCRFCERVVLVGVCCQAALDQAGVINEDKDAKWLWDLDHRIWEAKDHTDTRWQRRFYYLEKGRVTEDELKKVKELAPKFIVEPVNACMGFNFGINVYAPMMSKDEEEFALNHGIEKLKVVPLLCITGKHFDTRFEETWKKLSPLSHNKQNEKKLKRYGFEELKDAGHYDY